MPEVKLCVHQSFREYKGSNDRVIGKCCNDCGAEFLKKNYGTHVAAVDLQDSPDGDIFEERKPIKPKTNKAFQISPNRTRIRNIDMLQKGDHVAWQRVISYWHEGIVTQVDHTGVHTITWTEHEVTKEVGIHEHPEPDISNSCFNQMYRINYEPKIIQKNPTELVLARARSRETKPGDKVFYKLRRDNCESFATYCKTGHAQSHQVEWLYNKIGNSLVNACAKTCTRGVFAGAVIFSEVVEESVEKEVGYRWSQAIGALILIVLEMMLVSCDLKTYYGQPHFRTESTKRTFEGVFGVGISLLFSAIFDFFSGCLYDLFMSILCSHKTAVIAFSVIAVVCGLAVSVLFGIIGGFALNELQTADCSQKNNRLYLLSGVVVAIIAGGFIGCVSGATGGVIGVALGEWDVEATTFSIAVGAVIGVLGAICQGYIGFLLAPRCLKGYAVLTWITTVLICGGVGGVVGYVFTQWDSDSRSRVGVAVFDVCLGLTVGIAGGILGRIMGHSIGSGIGERCCTSESNEAHQGETTDTELTKPNTNVV